MKSFSDSSKSMLIGSECFLTILKPSNRPKKDSVVAENHHLEACTPPRTGIIPRTRPENMQKWITFWHVFRASTRFGLSLGKFPTHLCVAITLWCQWVRRCWDMQNPSTPRDTSIGGSLTSREPRGKWVAASWNETLDFRKFDPQNPQNSCAELSPRSLMLAAPMLISGVLCRITW